MTAEGARTSHAAVVARELGMVCIVGCEGLAIGPSGCNGTFGAQTIEEGEVLSVDGDKGDIYRGEIEVVRTRPTALLDKMPPRENLWALSPRLWFDFCICC